MSRITCIVRRSRRPGLGAWRRSMPSGTSRAFPNTRLPVQEPGVAQAFRRVAVLRDPAAAEDDIAVEEDGSLSRRNRNLRRVENHVGAPISHSTNHRWRRRMTMADLDARADRR